MVVLIAGIQRPLKFDSGVTSHLFATELEDIIGAAQFSVRLMRTKVTGTELVRDGIFSIFNRAEHHISIFSVLQKELRPAGTVPVVMTTHDPGMMDLADRVFTLEDGEIVDER